MASFGPRRQTECGEKPGGFTRLTPEVLSWVKTVTVYEVPRVNMIQRRSCYYEPYDKQLTCQCTDKETNTFLKLRLMFFIKEKGQEVRTEEH